jgi:hypothetical protein
MLGVFILAMDGPFHCHNKIEVEIFHISDFCGKACVCFLIMPYSPFCVPAKVTKLIGLKSPPFLSPTNLIIFAWTQNGE